MYDGFLPGYDTILAKKMQLKKEKSKHQIPVDFKFQYGIILWIYWGYITLYQLHKLHGVTHYDYSQNEQVR